MQLKSIQHGDACLIVIIKQRHFHNLVISGLNINVTDSNPVRISNMGCVLDWGGAALVTLKMVASGAEVPYLGYDLVWGRGALDGSYGLVWGGDALVTFVVWGRCALDESYLLVWGGGALLGDVMIWSMCALVGGAGLP